MTYDPNGPGGTNPRICVEGEALSLVGVPEGCLELLSP